MGASEAHARGVSRHEAHVYNDVRSVRLSHNAPENERQHRRLKQEQLSMWGANTMSRAGILVYFENKPVHYL
jgi:hypothetical protein